jgi:hypothetical protein
MPEPVVDATLDILGTPSAAEQRVSPDVKRILGRPPRTFAEWAARNITAFNNPSGDEPDAVVGLGQNLSGRDHLAT